MKNKEISFDSTEISDEAFAIVKDGIKKLLDEGYVLTIKYLAPIKKGGGFHLRIDKLEEE